jgi:hypothetical protein
MIYWPKIYRKEIVEASADPLAEGRFSMFTDSG